MGFFHGFDTGKSIQSCKVSGTNSTSSFNAIIDTCTIKEIQSISQRFDVACKMDAGKNYKEVIEETGASSATISRVNRCINYGDGGYKMVLQKLEKTGE